MIKSLLFIAVFIGQLPADAQNFMELWPSDNLPNSKHLNLTDSIANERIYRVGKPGVYAFFTSKEENKGAAVVICPGGGYGRLAYNIGGWQLAKWFNTMGVTAFVLNYRLPNSPDLIHRETGPLMDAQRAIRFIRSHAAGWGIKADRIGIMGASAGGHLAASAGTFTEDVSAIGDSLDRYSFRPDFMILVSPVIDLGTSIAHAGSANNLLGPGASGELKRKFSVQNRVSSTTPPCFIVDAVDDKTVDPVNSLLFYEALLKNKVPVSFHAFTQGGHSIALRNNPGATDLWTQLCEAWLIERDIIPERLTGK